jgi:hypothetical protein
MHKLAIATAAVLLTSFVGNAAMAACADDLAHVKSRLAAQHGGHHVRQDVGIAAVKIAEAQAALVDHDEDACIGFVHAANAELSN